MFKEVAFTQATGVVSRYLKFKLAIHRFMHMGFEDSPMHLIKKYQIRSDFTFIYFTKGYPLVEGVRKLMRGLHSNGIYGRVQQQNFYILKKHFSRHGQFSSKMISFKNVYVAFDILLVGKALSFLVLLGEITNKNYIHFWWKRIGLYCHHYLMSLSLNAISEDTHNFARKPKKKFFYIVFSAKHQISVLFCV